MRRRRGLWDDQDGRSPLRLRHPRRAGGVAMRLSVSTVMLLAAAGTSGYTPAELGRILAADTLDKYEERRAVDEWAKDQQQQEDKK